MSVLWFEQRATPMKKIFFAFLISSFLPLSVFAQDVISFWQALQEKKISIVAKGNDNSTHYIKPIFLSIKNLTKKDLSLQIPAGTIFKSFPTDYQDLIVTKSETITLKGSSTLNKYLYGCCIEATEGAPNKEVGYEVEEAQAETPTRSQLQQLAIYIDQQKLYGKGSAQSALWIVSNQYSIDNLYDNKSLQDYVATLTGQTITNDYTPQYNYQVTDNTQVANNYTAPPQKEMKGSLNYQLIKTSEVRLGMFNAEDILVREIYIDKESKAGTHKMTFAFDANVYTDAVYYFKLIIDEEVIIKTSLRTR